MINTIYKTIVSYISNGIFNLLIQFICFKSNIFYKKMSKSHPLRYLTIVVTICFGTSSFFSLMHLFPQQLCVRVLLKCSLSECSFSSTRSNIDPTQSFLLKDLSTLCLQDDSDICNICEMVSFLQGMLMDPVKSKLLHARVGSG